ncbi:hypothetical protein EOL73_01495 [Candidatus Saccharibacteria bacterium]|nr:hypothetical protein [Candidatus Saccharibacteria bacterium]
MNIPQSIVSQTDLAALIFEMKNYEKWFTSTAIKQTVEARTVQAVIPSLSQPALELLKNESRGNPLSREHIDQIIDSLESYQANSPAITVTLAAPPSQSLKISLAKWCHENLSNDMLVNFRFNSTLLGGMVVQCGSHIYDWSWRRAI